MWSQFRRWSRSGTWDVLVAALHETYRLRTGWEQMKPLMLVIDSALATGSPGSSGLRSDACSGLTGNRGSVPYGMRGVLRSRTASSEGHDGWRTFENTVESGAGWLNAACV